MSSLPYPAARTGSDSNYRLPPDPPAASCLRACLQVGGALPPAPPRPPQAPAWRGRQAPHGSTRRHGCIAATAERVMVVGQGWGGVLIEAHAAALSRAE